MRSYPRGAIVGWPCVNYDGIVAGRRLAGARGLPNEWVS